MPHKRQSYTGTIVTNGSAFALIAPSREKHPLRLARLYGAPCELVSTLGSLCLIILNAADINTSPKRKTEVRHTIVCVSGLPANLDALHTSVRTPLWEDKAKRGFPALCFLPQRFLPPTAEVLLSFIFPILIPFPLIFLICCPRLVLPLSGKQLSSVEVFVKNWFRRTAWKGKPLLKKLWGKKGIAYSTFWH